MNDPHGFHVCFACLFPYRNECLHVISRTVALLSTLVSAAAPKFGGPLSSLSSLYAPPKINPYLIAMKPNAPVCLKFGSATENDRSFLV